MCWSRLTEKEQLSLMRLVVKNLKPYMSGGEPASSGFRCTHSCLAAFRALNSCWPAMGSPCSLVKLAAMRAAPRCDVVLVLHDDLQLQRATSELASHVRRQGTGMARMDAYIYRGASQRPGLTCRAT
jgi:hypothetical protein